jgi:hypothetical protein
MEVDPSVRVAEYTSEFGRWDEVERPSDPRLRPYVHGYFASSSSLVRPARERHLPTAEVPMVLNFGASHTRLHAGSDSGPQRLDLAWVTGLQTHYHLSEAIGKRRFMVVRFTPLGAHLFFHLSMDSLTDRSIPLEQVDPRIASLVSDHVMIARGWGERFDAMERLIGSRVARYAVPPHVERVWNGLVTTLGTDARWIAGCRRQVQPPPSDPAVSHLHWASAKEGRHVASVQLLDQCYHSERTGKLAAQAASRGISAAGRRRSRGALGTCRG